MKASYEFDCCINCKHCSEIFGIYSCDRDLILMDEDDVLHVCTHYEYRGEDNE